MNKANKEIRQAISESGAYHWQVAEQLGVHETTLSRWLRVELNESNKQAILKALDELNKERS